MTAKMLSRAVVDRWRQIVGTIVVPCRMCQAAPGAPCTYKGREIDGVLGGHDKETPVSDRRFHYKRVRDARAIADLIAMKEAA